MCGITGRDKIKNDNIKYRGEIVPIIKKYKKIVKKNFNNLNICKEKTLL